MIPSLRETLTQLVYKVQAALAMNKCSSAFWTGSLKNKNIKGDDILSQVIIYFPPQFVYCKLSILFLCFTN